MAISKELLKSVFASDELGLIDRVDLQDNAAQREALDIADLRDQELHDWMEAHEREPDYGAKDPLEKMLATRLKKKREREAAPPQGIEDADPLHSAALDKMLSEMQGSSSIHDFSNSILKTSKEKKKPAAYTSRRAPIKDFARYEPIFQKVQAEIDAKLRRLVPFSASDMKEGRFYIAGGILCYVEELFEKELNSFGRRDNRMHIIFANGTESYMLFASFQKIMSEENGRSVTEIDAGPQGFSLEKAAAERRRKFEAPDVEGGWIYILRTASDSEAVRQFGGKLYKVGYTSQRVEDRIKNAESEATYLCAPVIIEKTWRCLNINGKSLETFLHNFFKAAQVLIKVNEGGKSQTASEWFNVPLKTLEAAVPLIISGEIRNYKYEHSSGALVRAN